MIASTLIDLIFKSKIDVVDFGFIDLFFYQVAEINFIDPVLQKPSLNELKEILQTSDYVNFTISTNSLLVYEKTVQRVFIDIFSHNGEVECLLYFDIQDLLLKDNKSAITYLKDWCLDFSKKYKFDYFICQFDSGSEEEYYFDTNGVGPWYHKL